MLQILKVAASIAALSLVIPIFIWMGTGNFRHAMHAWKQWALYMGGMAVVGCGLGALAFLAS